MAASHSSDRSARPPLSFRKKLLFSATACFLFFLILEAALFFAGVQPVVATEDPFVGFSGSLPLMVEETDEEGRQIYRTAKNKLIWFNDQSFTKKKPQGCKRIFCIGGSTTYGHPYSDSTSFSRWLREFLPLADDKTTWEVINAGGISYASYRDAKLMEEFAAYEPDLFILYSVHNEFLERRTYSSMFDRSSLLTAPQAWVVRTRIGSVAKRLIANIQQQSSAKPQTKIDLLPAEVDEMLNHTVGPVDYHRLPEWRKQVMLHYEVNLERMIQIAKKAGAGILLITPASNTKDCSPFKSEHSENISSSVASQVENLLDAAKDALGQQKHAEAKRLLERARTADPLYAETHYRLGQAYAGLGEFDEADQAFEEALNQDVCPLRAVREISETIERVGRRNHVPLVDLEGELRKRCKRELGHELLGKEYFVDHVHFDIETHRRLALWIMEELASQKWIPSISVHRESQIETIGERVRSELNPHEQGVALRNLAKVFHWAGKFEEAAPLAEQALSLIPNDPPSRFVLAGCLRVFGKKEEAIEEYERLFETEPGFARGYQAFGELLAEEGYWSASKAYLIAAVVHNPKNGGALMTLGNVHLELDEFKFAEECFVAVDHLFPGDAEVQKKLKVARDGLESSPTETHRMRESPP